jgi:hypothetical protein
MKVSNFNGNFLPNNQNKEQKSNLQDKAVMQNSVNFKGSAANDSLSAMGQAQVNMNKAKNLSFKGKPAVNILANIAERSRPEELRELSQEFGRKVTKYYPSEEHFDKAVIDHIFDKNNKRLNESAFRSVTHRAWQSSDITDADKFFEHITPDEDQIIEYAKTHPLHKTNFKNAVQEIDRGLLTATGSTIAATTAIAAAPATGGLSVLLAPAAAGLIGGGVGASQIKSGETKLIGLVESVFPEFRASCLNYKVKRLIAKDKLNIKDLVSEVDPKKIVSEVERRPARVIDPSEYGPNVVFRFDPAENYHGYTRTVTSDNPNGGKHKHKHKHHCLIQ